MSVTDRLIDQAEGYVHAEPDDESGDPFATNLGSEPELRPDEVICEVTNLTYYHKLPRSPHIDTQGRPI